MFRVLVSDNIAEEGLQPLLADSQIAVVHQNVNQVTDLANYDALLVRSATKVTGDLLAKMPNLKIIGRAGAGVDNIDVAKATERGIIVVNAPTGNTISTAEHAFGMMLALARRIVPAANSLKQGHWERSTFQGIELEGKTLGILGFGRIGQELAKRALAFNMQVLAYSPSLTAERAKKHAVTAVNIETLIKQAEIISIHAALNNATRSLLNRDNLGKTRPGVLIINCARGEIIDQEALKYFLETGHIAGAALDVFPEEPPTNFDLIKMDQVLATPHIAASTEEAQLKVALIVAQEVLNFAKGKPIKNQVNP